MALAHAYISDLPAAPILAEVVRSGFVEGCHRGSLVALAADGSVEFALGTPEAPVYPRSSNKPVQAVAVLRTGLRLAGEQLALAAASHSGETFHLEGVRKVLADHGLTEDDLRNPVDLPMDPVEAEAWMRAGRERDRLAMNCSGKHAAMLAACRGRGWDLESYLAPEHPLQVEVRAALEELSGETVASVGVDGCGAPLMAVSLIGLARAFRAMALGAEGSAERRVADAMRAHPEYVAGTRRTDTWLMRGLPGAVAKIGAEGVQALALADGRALAFKLDDGAERARGPVLAAALRRMGAAAEDGLLDRLGAAPLLGAGAVVGAVRATF
ncbi:asparaginase [Phaeacidiphilus oryzae]|uniref:asparaginase n=1 Tax=Phaeacidiphilus oryzae TaxID=348818 RepID=UPI00068A3DF7|nr:asparaginase [Phaeacidiphilus oryzae]